MRMTIGAAIVATGVAFSGQALADRNQRTYEITITNITKGVQFTPILASTHSKAVRYFTAGETASEELALLAEAGDVGPLQTALEESGEAHDFANSADFLPSGQPPLLDPGEKVTMEITSRRGFRWLSLAAMLLPTNDSFVAVNAIRLPKRGAKTVLAIGYDAGTELNDEVCDNIPGPVCEDGTGPSPGIGGEGHVTDGEGHVHVSNGIHGIADLSAAAYDWRNPIARVENP